MVINRAQASAIGGRSLPGILGPPGRRRAPLSCCVHPCHAAFTPPSCCVHPPVMLRAVAASRKRPQNSLSPEWLDSATARGMTEWKPRRHATHPMPYRIPRHSAPPTMPHPVMLRPPRHAAHSPAMLRTPPPCCALPHHAAHSPIMLRTPLSCCALPCHAARSRSIQKMAAERFKPGVAGFSRLARGMTE